MAGNSPGGSDTGSKTSVLSLYEFIPQYLIMPINKGLNRNLNRAKKAKNDEFYTQLSDIERECKYYKKHFKGKVVYCNCDDPRTSNFFHYFSYNFDHLGLKRLLNGDGDFRSAESIELLKQADIVVTNPPFSLFREYVSQLMEHNKKFLIIGNINAITYKDIFPLLKENKIWLGHCNGGVTFRVPDSFASTGAGYHVDDKGQKWMSLGNICWFTNLDIQKRREDLILCKSYTSREYPKYDNYDAINVDKIKYIPMDYVGVMGVPITFLDKHNPDQFEIIGSNQGIDQDPNRVYGRGSRLNGKETFKRIFIRNKRLCQ
jgi:hypothetical protein